MAEYHIYVTWKRNARWRLWICWTCTALGISGHGVHRVHCDYLWFSRNPSSAALERPNSSARLRRVRISAWCHTSQTCPGLRETFPKQWPNGKYRQVRPSPFWFGKIRQCNPDLLPVSPRHDSCFIHLHTGTSPLAQSVFSQPPRYEPYRPPSHRESAVDLADFWRYPGSTSFGVNYLFDVQVFVWTVVAPHATDLLVDVSWKVRDVRWC